MSYPPNGEEMNDRMFAQLKPVRLDELADESYRRRRSDDLARAFQTTRTPPRPFRRLLMPRRPMLFLTATAAAGLAAAAVVVVPGLVTDSPRSVPGGHTAAVSPDAGSTEQRSTKPVDARSFLLAAAETVAREPAGSGRYWYTRERVFQKISVAEEEYKSALNKLIADYEGRKAKVKGRDDEVKALDEELNDEVSKLKARSLPYAAFASYTAESWRALHAGAKSRSITNQNMKITFGSPEDEAVWKEAGSPVLLSTGKPKAYDSTEQRVLSIGNPSLTVGKLADLPTGKKEMERWLRDMYAKSPDRSGPDARSFTEYLPQTALDLLSAPIKPGTRSALFKVLAEQPGITSKGEVTDGLGRTGVALASRFDWPNEGEFEFTLTFDERSADLLEYTIAKVGEPHPVLRTAFEKLGWADRLGRRP
jgi:hypothetical protein